MKVRSLARQAAVIVLVTQLLCALALSGAALFNERHTRFHAFDAQLRGRSDSLLGAIQDADDPADNVAVDPTELKLPSTDVYAVYNQGGRLLGQSKDASPAIIVRGADGFRNAQVNGTSYRIYQREALRIIDRAETSGVGLRRPVTIVFASPDGHVWHEIWEAARFYLIAILLATATTVFIVTILLRKALRPLGDLADEASRLSAPTLQFRAPESVQQVRELQPLARVLTDMAADLRHAFQKEQRFISDAAHELKTAIAVVRSSVQVLMMRDRTVTEYRMGLQRVFEDNTRVESLVAQMLRLASVETAAAEGTSMADLSQTTLTVCGQLSSIAEERAITLQTDVEPECLLAISSDRAGTLVSNLVLNAVQHSHAGSVVAIKLHRAGRELRLLVADQGRGIADDALPHLFERFFREDASRSRDTGGAGLGLSICKAIVDDAGGTIHVSSKQGVGTTVVVAFTQA